MTTRQRYLTALATCQAAGMTPEEAKKLARQIATRYINCVPLTIQIAPTPKEKPDENF